jgi:hypothetical protein
VEVEIDTDMVEEKLEIRGGGERGGEWGQLAEEEEEENISDKI